MEDEIIENIIDNLHGLLPIIHKKLIGVLDEGANRELSHFHYAILGILSESGPLPVSVIGRRMLISKPQMTAMLDRLAELGLIARTPDTEDRRVIRISLSAKGKKSLEKASRRMRENIKQKLSGLSREDRESLAEALARIKTIGCRIE
jgi:MarR family transcriptional regulator, organic hydroperoxide resistance regulator